MKGKLATAEEAPILAVAPHSSFFDALPITFLDLTSVVAKADAENVPIFGSMWFVMSFIHLYVIYSSTMLYICMFCMRSEIRAPKLLLECRNFVIQHKTQF